MNFLGWPGKEKDLCRASEQVTWKNEHTPCFVDSCRIVKSYEKKHESTRWRLKWWDESKSSTYNKNEERINATIEQMVIL